MHQEGQKFKPWTIADFLPSQRVPEDDGLQAAKDYEGLELQRIKHGKIDESELPAWARMTPEEKRARGIQ